MSTKLMLKIFYTITENAHFVPIIKILKETINKHLTERLKTYMEMNIH